MKLNVKIYLKCEKIYAGNSINFYPNADKNLEFKHILTDIHTQSSFRLKKDENSLIYVDSSPSKESEIKELKDLILKEQDK